MWLQMGWVVTMRGSSQPTSGKASVISRTIIDEWHPVSREELQEQLYYAFQYANNNIKSTSGKWVLIREPQWCVR